MEHLIQINSTCIGCNLCIIDCPSNNIILINQKASIIQQNCIHCGHCVAICPKQAVSITGFDDEPIELTNQPRLDPNLLMQVYQSGRSTRNFKDTHISQEIIHQLIEAGRYSPSATNAQDVSYIIIQNKINEIENIAIHLFKKCLPFVKMFYAPAKRIQIDNHFFFKKAPLVILIVSRNNTNGMISTTRMALMAESLGLGVLYSGFFTIATKLSRKLRHHLKLKSGERVVATLVLGYPHVNYHRTTQKEAVNITAL
ncbi:nitroreductase family protein [Anaerorhabdus sp.]|uniref:nitroreductase family protein n=1 Tax=Anaerorhabdus sp. TaxID=1872524 RepID=UPI002FC87CC8